MLGVLLKLLRPIYQDRVRFPSNHNEHIEIALVEFFDSLRLSYVSWGGVGGDGDEMNCGSNSSCSSNLPRKREMP
jgi:hypothetical protein